MVEKNISIDQITSSLIVASKRKQLILKRIVFYSLISIYVSDVLFWVFSGYGGYGAGYSDQNTSVSSGGATIPIIGSIGNIFFLPWISIICCLYLFIKTSWRRNIPKKAYILFSLVLFCNFICFIRGIESARGYFDWKQVLLNPQGGLSQFSPVIMVVAMSTENAINVFKFFLLMLKVTLLLVPLQILKILATEESYAHIVISVLPLLLLVPYLPYKKKSLVLVVALISLILTLTWRTNEIRIILIFLFLFCLQFYRLLGTTILNFLNIILFCLPLILIIVTATTGKSVFKMGLGSDNQVTESASNQSIDLGDTRTLLYTEVIADLITNNSLVFGKGTNAKYKSNIFVGDSFKKGRGNVEVGALKIMLFSGLIGLILISLLFFIAAWYGTNATQNSLTKFFSFFIMLHWVLLFIENIPDYNVYYYSLWIIVGLCLSKKFRSLTDGDIKAFFSNNFRLKHRLTKSTYSSYK